MCGSPAVPNISAMPNEMAEIGSLMKPPGPMMPRPARGGLFGGFARVGGNLAVRTSTPLAKSASGLKPNCASTMKAMKVTPAKSIRRP
jgi:hypothetical protein